MGLTMNISMADWGYTAAATGFMYMWGYRYSELGEGGGGSGARALPHPTTPPALTSSPAQTSPSLR